MTIERDIERFARPQFILPNAIRDTLVEFVNLCIADIECTGLNRPPREVERYVSPSGPLGRVFGPALHILRNQDVDRLAIDDYDVAETEAAAEALARARASIPRAIKRLNDTIREALPSTTNEALANASGLTIERVAALRAGRGA